MYVYVGSLLELAILCLVPQYLVIKGDTRVVLFNLLNPTGYVMHQQFSVQHLYSLPTLYLFCIYLRTNSDLCHLHHKLTGFYNRDEKCLLHGTN